MRTFGRERNERGATLVEFAFVVPILLLLIFAAIDFGVAYNNQQSLRNAAREAGRRAIVGPSKVAEHGCAAGDVACLVKARADAGDLTGASTWTKVCFPASASGTDDCPTTNPGAKNIGDVIRICAIYPVDSLTGLLSPFLNNVRLTTRVNLRLEQPWPAANTTTAADTGQRGTWDFCDD